MLRLIVTEMAMLWFADRGVCVPLNSGLLASQLLLVVKMWNNEISSILTHTLPQIKINSQAKSTLRFGAPLGPHHVAGT